MDGYMDGCTFCTRLTQTGDKSKEIKIRKSANNERGRGRCDQTSDRWVKRMGGGKVPERLREKTEV